MMTLRRGAPVAAPGARAGFSLLEVSIASTVLMLGVLMFSQTIVGGIGGHQSVRERGLAVGAMESTLERLRSEAFSTLFTRYNGSSADDPGGAGSAPGAGFDVPGLNAINGDADGLPGEILFPVGPGVGTAGLLREDLDLPRFGLPYDLNHDGVIASGDVSSDYRLLPVVVRVRWRGNQGTTQMEVVTWLSKH